MRKQFKQTADMFLCTDMGRKLDSEIQKQILDCQICALSSHRVVLLLLNPRPFFFFVCVSPYLLVNGVGSDGTLSRISKIIVVEVIGKKLVEGSSRLLTIGNACFDSAEFS